MEAVISGWPPALQGLLAGCVLAGLNLLGSLVVLVWRRPSAKALDIALGFTAGVMLTASFTSLILPGIREGGLTRVLIGMGLGAVLLDLADHWIPHFHPILGMEGTERAQAARLRGVWLFVIAITLHNMPEGLAVGVGVGSGRFREALALTLAIGIQNIPEGFAVAVSALSAGLGSRWYTAVVGIRSGLVEIPLAVLGAWLVSSMRVLLPYAMGFAAGAMLYVISDEIIPESHRQGHERGATWGTLLGAALMLTLDIALG